MSRNPLQQRLIQIVEPVVESSGFELVDLRFLLEQTGWTLRVQVSLPLPERADTSDLAAVPTDRVDLHDCENLSHELSAKLDVEDPIPQAYSLEVSSPGIDRALRTARHFAHFTGADARIALAVPLQTDTGERRNFRGVLRGVDSDHVSIECDGQTFRLAIADIDHAKLVPDWDAVMHGKSGVGAPAPKSDKKSAKPAKPKHQKQQKEP
jgi:ribosome maturation factor RimP